MRLALFTTEHFRDVLEIARLKIPDMYNLLSKRAAPLITRDLVFGVAGRLKADGSVQDELDEASVARAVEGARAAGAEGIVISFLHAYRNPAHELAAKAIVERLAPEIPVFCSNETWPIIREYERTITAAIGAYVQPRVAHYLGSLQQALKDVGVTADPRLTKSNGGVMTAEQGKNQCVQMILSGTASGVIGASYVAEICGIERCMSLDIGGTSADVAVIIGGQPQYGVGEQIGEFQIFIPSVSVSSIGEGGGSIAWIDSQGVLKVGPESAGSRPGPACYGRGGTRATITDAFAALGLIGLSEIGYSAVTIDRAAARRVVGELAERARAHDRADRRGDHSHRRIGHVFRRQRAGLALRHRSARILLPRLRRRRADDGLFPGARARHAGGRRADHARRAERARRPDRRPQERLHQDALCRSRRRDGRRHPDRVRRF